MKLRFHDYRGEDTAPGREIDEWIDAITRRHWFAAMKSLPGEVGFWIGTEEELIEELKARMLEEQDDGDALVDEVFPSSAGEIIEPPQDVDWAMRKERLSLTDYRTMEKELRENYDAPGWGRKAPILLERHLAAHKPSHEGAQITLATKYHNPLAILVVGLTYDDPKFKSNQRMWSGSARWWSGRTRDLADRLRIQLHSDFGLRSAFWALSVRSGRFYSRFNCRRVASGRIVESQLII